MRVSLFGLFLRCTSLMEPWPKLVQSVLLVLGFIRISCFMIIMSYLFIPAIPVYTLVLILARHLAFVPPLAWGVSSDSPGSSCPGFGAWSVWILPVADQSSAAVAWTSCWPSWALSFQAPCVPLEFSLSKLVSAFYTVYSSISLVFPQLRLSGDVILL